VAIKEASGNTSKVVETAMLVGDTIDLYSGNDDQVVPLLSMGGSGVISVLSNVMPAATVEMCRKFFAGDVAGAAEIQLRLLRLMNHLMIETNPIPVKAACAAMGFGKYILRLPLVEMEEKNRAKLIELMKEQGLEADA
jgi:4-hydroxy-tetrahydrodipicolinate synthase